LEDIHTPFDESAKEPVDKEIGPHIGLAALDIPQEADLTDLTH
jgi:hypothetical protein